MRIAHILHRFDIGGLENVVAHLINHLPQDRFDHAIISLTEVTDFKQRVNHPRVTFHALHKKPGKDLAVWFRLWRLLRRLQPDLIHTCNLAAMEAVIPARLAGVGRVIHAEHGRDSYDPHGTNRKYLLLRRLLAPFVDGFVPVSAELATWLIDKVGVPSGKVCFISNGVTLPQQNARHPSASGETIIGTVGRMWSIKDHPNLVHAFFRLSQLAPQRPLRLMIVGDGPERPAVQALIDRLGIADRVRITGWRPDARELMANFDLFVLSSQAEGTPLTILEAMAASLPVVATRVGGVPDLVVDGQTGALVPPGDAEALARAMLPYLDPELAARHGAAGRARIAEQFSLTAMVEAYRRLFEG
ncbi:MAG: TIGR03088 family PEP-CTERM/XrtA system glycosyltransferase [Magnetococcales bacterium]|nr:TIGR03088 family PEP-CTERM/XrtA system glycosyltransferase [Magnetococcales bacterium]